MTVHNESLPHGDDIQGADAQSEQALLDAVLSNSQFVDEVEPLPEEHELIDDTAELELEEDPEVPEEVDTEEEVEEEVDELEDEDAEESEEDEDATQEADIFTADDLDLDAVVRVKVDGEELDVSFADLLKGYQTDASLSKKGREIGEAKKQIEKERSEKLQEALQLSEASAAILMKEEASHAQAYHEIEAKIQEARDEGDTFQVSELKDEREQLQKKYWEARNAREGLQGKVQEKQQELELKAWEEQVNYFNETIEEHVPGFDQDLAFSIREFAIGEGIDEDIVDTIADPVVVRVLNDYRKLKEGVIKGEAKRKAVPTKKAVPAKKGKTVTQKSAEKAKMTKARAFKEDASKEDQMAFLRDYAAKSLGNI